MRFLSKLFIACGFILTLSSCDNGRFVEIKEHIRNYKNDSILISIDSGLSYVSTKYKNYKADSLGNLIIRINIENPCIIYFHIKTDSSIRFMDAMFIVPGKKYYLETDNDDDKYQKYGTEDITNNFYQSVIRMLNDRVPNICQMAAQKADVKPNQHLWSPGNEYYTNKLNLACNDAFGELSKLKNKLNDYEYHYLYQRILLYRERWLYMFGRRIQDIPITDPYFDFITNFNFEPDTMYCIEFREVASSFLRDLYLRQTSLTGNESKKDYFEFIRRHLKTKKYQDYFQGYYLYFGLLSWDGVDLKIVDSLYANYTTNNPNPVLLNQITKRLNEVREIQQKKK